MSTGLGNGTTVTFATSGLSVTLMSISRSGRSVEDVETSSMSTTGTKTYIAAALEEGGTLQMECQYDPSTTVTLGGDVETITVDYAGSGDTDSFSGYANAEDNAAEIDGLMTQTITVKIAG